jgi:hypothetical protein
MSKETALSQLAVFAVERLDGLSSSRKIEVLSAVKEVCGGPAAVEADQIIDALQTAARRQLTLTQLLEGGPR